MNPAFTIVRVGDAAVIVRFEERVAPDVNRKAMRLAAELSAAGLPGVRDVVPSFCAVTVHFDPVRTDAGALFDLLSREPSAAGPEPAPAGAVEIPVCYGGEFGPDLRDVAAFSGMQEDDVIQTHAAVVYRVYMVGFAPGFAYLAEVDPRIAMPRRPTPRLTVAAGSVAVAGPQTGVYPADLPGGWNVIGRTPLRMFEARRTPPSLLRAGDRVSFTPISRDRFERLSGERLL